MSPLLCIFLIFCSVCYSLFGTYFIKRTALFHYTDGVAFAGKGKEGGHKCIKVFIAVDDLTVCCAVDGVAYRFSFWQLTVVSESMARSVAGMISFFILLFNYL